MADSPITERILSELEHLTPAQQQEVLDFAIQIQRKLPPGIPGEELIALARRIDFPPEDIAEIMRAVEEEFSGNHP